MRGHGRGEEREGQEHTGAAEGSIKEDEFGEAECLVRDPERRVREVKIDSPRVLVALFNCRFGPDRKTIDRPECTESDRDASENRKRAQVEEVGLGV